jgi:formamidopyrimidine-DNA glycosylase
MPELPEVQTIITDLNEKIKGDTVVGFWTDWDKAIKNKSATRFTKEIRGRKILGARRIGKNIFVDLSDGKTLYIHLKMTGHLLIKKQDTRNKIQTKSKIQISNSKTDYFSYKVNKYIHHVWKLKSGRTLEFSDLRKFGKIALEDTDKINNLKEIVALGVDAMSEEFTFSEFQKILDKKKKSPIGLVLMDQNSIAGIGNIYRSEILFSAGILPTRKIETITLAERKKLYASTLAILKKAIKYRGTSDSDYRDTSGAPGGYQKIARVYRRDKRACQKCGTIIKRETLGQRSIFYCERCQR